MIVYSTPEIRVQGRIGTYQVARYQTLGPKVGASSLTGAGKVSE